MKALLLLSGGMDSALCLLRYRDEIALAVGYDYGQRHRIELDYAAELAGAVHVPFERIRIPALPLVSDVVYAGRNAVLLSYGAAIAQAKGLWSVVIGCNADDALRFPDCREAFIKPLSEAISDAYGVSIRAPLLKTSKLEIARATRNLRTWSCYSPEFDEPCNECLACRLRDKAMTEALA